MTAPRSTGRLTANQLAGFIMAYYAMDNPTGGSLHIVVEDGNIEDSDVAFCLRWAQRDGDVHGARLAVRLLEASRTQRAKACRVAHAAMAVNHGHWPGVRYARVLCWTPDARGPIADYHALAVPRPDDDTGALPL